MSARAAVGLALVLSGAAGSAAACATSDSRSPEVRANQRAAPAGVRAGIGDPFAAPRRPRRFALVWAVGDGADGGSAARALARRIHASEPARFLYLGDVYLTGTAAEFARNYHTVYGRLARRTTPTPGDNDWPNHRVGYDPYWKRVTGRATRHFAAVSVGGWEILTLNSERPADRKQLQWLRARVAARGTCRIAMWHRPRYSAGHYGDEVDVAPLWDALRGRASIVLNGHDHNMQRLRPRDGVTTFVSGAGGRSRYPVDRSDPRVAFANDSDWGALRLELRPGSARHAFVAASGRVLDAGVIRCRRRS